MSFNSFCFLCLANYKNLNSINAKDTDGHVILTKLGCFLPDTILFKSEIFKKICNNCLDNVNNIYKFRQKYVDNINILDEYVEQLIEKFGPSQNIPVTLPDVLYFKQCKKICESLKTEEDMITDSCDVSEPSETDEFHSLSKKNTQSTDTSAVPSNSETQNSNTAQSNDSSNSEESNDSSVKHENEDQEQINPVLNDMIMNNDIVHIEEAPEPKSGKLSLINSKFQCAVCDKLFHRKHHLQSHSRIHTGERPFECRTCQKKFIQIGHLKRHELTHVKTVRYPCDRCGKEFKDLHNLDCHKKVHSDTRPFVCSICEKLFVKSGDLSRHMTRHTGAKPYYECHLCEFRCPSNSNLNEHFRTHSDDKNFVCKHCKESFTQLKDLCQHVKRQHNV